MELISSYTRQQAIDDGVLVDLSENSVIKQHWKYPLACTDGVWATIQKACESKFHDLDGILLIYQPSTTKRNAATFENNFLELVELVEHGELDLAHRNWLIKPN